MSDDDMGVRGLMEEFRHLAWEPYRLAQGRLMGAIRAGRGLDDPEVANLVGLVERLLPIAYDGILAFADASCAREIEAIREARAEASAAVAGLSSQLIMSEVAGPDAGNG